ncbi:MAG: hypothetical protein ACREDP_13740, partial [Bradyrhizobium sp.]
NLLNDQKIFCRPNATRHRRGKTDGIGRTRPATRHTPGRPAADSSGLRFREKPGPEGHLQAQQKLLAAMFGFPARMFWEAVDNANMYASMACPDRAVPADVKSSEVRKSRTLGTSTSLSLRTHES